MKCEWIAEPKFVKEEEMAEAEAFSLFKFSVWHSQKSAWTTEWNSWLWKWGGRGVQGMLFWVFHWRLVTGLIDLSFNCGLSQHHQRRTSEGKPQEPLWRRRAGLCQEINSLEAGLLTLTFNAFQFTSSHTTWSTQGDFSRFGFRLFLKSTIGR